LDASGRVAEQGLPKSMPFQDAVVVRNAQMAALACCGVTAFAFALAVPSAELLLRGQVRLDCPLDPNMYSAVATRWFV
jgi:hypothetical protein